MANIKITSDGLPYNTKLLIGETDITKYVRYIKLIQNPCEQMEAHIGILISELDVEMPLDNVVFITEEENDSMPI